MAQAGSTSDAILSRRLFRCQWESDFGIDAHAECRDRNSPRGQTVAAQMAAGAAFFGVTTSMLFTVISGVPCAFHVWPLSSETPCRQGKAPGGSGGSALSSVIVTRRFGGM